MTFRFAATARRSPPSSSRCPAAGAAVRAGRGTPFEGDLLPDLVVAPPRLQLWRAPTDNDGLPLVADKHFGPLDRWLELGLDRYELELVREAPGRARAPRARSGHAHAPLPASWRTARSSSRTSSSSTRASATCRASASSSRCGPASSGSSWFGPGPWEAYSDRRASALVGRYRSTVTDEYVPYIFPQEHGHHPDARWLRLTDARGQRPRGARAPDDRVRREPLHRRRPRPSARHTDELTPRDEVILSLDVAQRGLGTASCGPDTAERYRLLEPRYAFAFELRRI